MGNTLIGVAAVVSAVFGGAAAVIGALNRRGIKTSAQKIDTVQDTVNGSTLVKERRIEQLTDALTDAGHPVPAHTAETSTDVGT